MLNKNITWWWFYQLNYIICESLQLRISFSTLYISTRLICKESSSRPFLSLLRNCRQASVVSYCWQKVKRLSYVNLETNAVEETHVEFIRLTVRWYKIHLSLFYYFGSATNSTVRRTDSVSLILDVRASNFQYKIHWPFIYVFMYLFIVMKWNSKYSFSTREMQTTKVENVGCGMN